MLKKISINGLRGFGECEDIIFSLPNGKDGSGLNVIVGPNNAGKTTIIEAIRVYNNQSENISFSEGKRNIKNNNKVDIIYYDENDQVYEIHTINSGGSQVTVKGISESNKIPYVLPSRRYVEYNMYNRNFCSDRNIYSVNQIFNLKNRAANLSQFDQRIFTWQDHKDKFNKILKRIIIDPFDWKIEQNDDGAYYIKIIFSDTSISHTREGMGDGYWSIFTIVDSLYDSEKNDVIVIDEPELSLHPAFQRRLLDLLIEYSKDRQIIITTHSPYFISLDAIINGGNLIRTYKNNLGNIKVGKIDDKDRNFIISATKDINNPHIFGLEAKELFFIEDNIIITEGQEDTIIIPKICKKLNIQLHANLYGWGVGGVGNIPKILNLLNNLGYNKVTAIFDGDKKKEYKKCKDLFQNYNIEILCEDDIRDKNESYKASKKGITTTSGEIKDEYKEYFPMLIDKINKYHLS